MHVKIFSAMYTSNQFKLMSTDSSATWRLLEQALLFTLTLTYQPCKVNLANLFTLSGSPIFTLFWPPSAPEGSLAKMFYYFHQLGCLAGGFLEFFLQKKAWCSRKRHCQVTRHLKLLRQGRLPFGWKFFLETSTSSPLQFVKLYLSLHVTEYMLHSCFKQATLPLLKLSVN